MQFGRMKGVLPALQNAQHDVDSVNAEVSVYVPLFP
jgi:hypothetical protein